MYLCSCIVTARPTYVLSHPDIQVEILTGPREIATTRVMPPEAVRRNNAAPINDDHDTIPDTEDHHPSEPSAAIATMAGYYRWPSPPPVRPTMAPATASAHPDDYCDGNLMVGRRMQLMFDTIKAERLAQKAGLRAGQGRTDVIRDFNDGSDRWRATAYNFRPPTSEGAEASYDNHGVSASKHSGSSAAMEFRQELADVRAAEYSKARAAHKEAVEAMEKAHELAVEKAQRQKQSTERAPRVQTQDQNIGKPLSVGCSLLTNGHFPTVFAPGKPRKTPRFARAAGGMLIVPDIRKKRES